MWLILVLLGVILAALLSVAGLIAVRRSPRLSRLVGDNDVPGLLFGAMGALYGALLAFVVFGTYESYSRAEQAVTTEGAELVGVYRDVQTFPEPQQTAAKQALRTYTTKVMANEWTSHGNLIVHTTPDLLNAVWDIYGQLGATTSQSQGPYTAAVDHLHTLELQRHLRHLSSEQTLPSLFWPVLVVGSVALIVFSFFFHLDNLRVQSVMTGLVTGMLALVLLLIYSLNSPFAGPMPVSQQPLQHALAQFDALDLPAPAP